jgi:hypothetical protein
MTYAIAVKSEERTVSIGDGSAQALETRTRDLFEGRFTLCFERDEHDGITGFTVDAGRVLGLKFLKR